MALSARAAKILKQIGETPEAKAATEMEQIIENKLNHDGRWPMLNPAESMLRLGRLTNHEAAFLGRLMGWDTPYYNGVDWAKVPVPFLAECVMREDEGMTLLRECYPAPGAELVNWQIVPEVALDALRDNEITLAELGERYPLQEGTKQ